MSPVVDASGAGREVLVDGLKALGLRLSDPQMDALMTYLGLLQKWNKVYNLTAVRDPAEMMTHHLLDSLAAIEPLVRQVGERTVQLLDVGSGGGLPGVVIAVACPWINVTCVDTVAKKAAFIQQVAATLRLPNLRGLHARVESLNALSGQGFDVVCSRAFASLVDFVNWSRGALYPGAVWMAMKGKHPDEELATLAAEAPGVEVFHVEQLRVPGLEAERCIVWMRPATHAVA
ncbi:MAG: 16S rRNA (guanine(527)-N(7))-methyltransferase RsmG [Betaproteobacteria bacterium HGW-Betaproteobacteria-15]|nr:MAG: 16S rRNA (guanine(527)-N(7))-methyltransferase RsmG [Betaproteobacteria bacterium HGW-Betaproteobacteria-15]